VATKNVSGKRYVITGRRPVSRLFQSLVATLQAKKKRVAQIDFTLAGIVSAHR